MSNYEQNIEALSRIEDSFIGTQVYAPDRADQTIIEKSSSAFMDAPRLQNGFQEIAFSPAELVPGASKAQLIGRVVLMPNRALDALSPAIIIPKNNGFELSMLDQPYDIGVGMTKGIHFGISVKAQTATNSFGEHGKGSFEVGHFSSVLLGVRDDNARGALLSPDHGATDAVVRNDMASALSSSDLLAAKYKSVNLSSGDTRRMKAYWHPTLDSEDGPITGNFQGALRVMLGGAVLQLGDKGVDTAMRLVDAAMNGAPRS